ncbi:ATP-binding cassette domain-containing protein [Actinoallomurus rhizosphaericola]|uniref:ATP-binding cassette domain-containing protein n=1 Tax=Actinoallomurus rhizosphaericola TaxID=2952536 RepID=UPI002092A7F5|nr:ATP-binding cassette domain-containing protein [Actinoallomurus rhizosphaericola]MCO5996736.1 ATP-binding cassette domain-containing protein [Actinoallomurus rhizosphaericola]
MSLPPVPAPTPARTASAGTTPAGTASTVPAIRAVDLRKRFADVTAVDGIDLTVAPGESFGFLGPNGAGKTTTIAMLCTLAAPTSGRIEIAGHDTRTDPAGARRSLGMVFQETTLDGDLTAAENLRFHADLYDVPVAEVPARIDETLALVGLTGHRDRLVRTYSGGMRRRLEIARALLHRPQVMFLDEPTVGLDPQARARVWRHLRQVCRSEKVTLFLTTHYLDEADQCDRIAIIDEGRIVAEGAPDALKSVLGTDRIHLRTADDVAAARLLHERLGLDAATGPSGLSLRVTDSTRVLRRLFTELDVFIYEAKVVRPTLDDVFLHHTGHRIRDDAPAEPDAPSPDPEPPAGPPPAVRPARTAPLPRGLPAELRALRMIWRREILHFARDRTGTAVSLLQPLLFLFVFGAGVAGLLPTAGGPDYQVFLFSGILLMAAQGPAVSVGASVLWDRQNGFLREMLVSPVRRGTVLAGKCLGGTTVAVCQAAMLLTAAAPIGVPFDLGLYALLLIELTLMALAMTAFGVLAATLIGRPQTFGTALTVVMAPLTFLSGAMFPLAAMPAWMASLALLNPLSYAVDGMRRTVAAYLAHPPGPLFQRLGWGHWHPPVLAECGLMAVGALLGLLLAARRFSRPA